MSAVSSAEVLVVDTKHAFRPLDAAGPPPDGQQKRPATPPTPNASHTPQNPPKKRRALSKALELPSGVSSGDRIRFFDLESKTTTDECIYVADDACDSTPLPFLEPDDNFRLVFEDGTGFVVGKCCMAQHGVRLRAHRKQCSRFECPVLGCGGERSVTIFDSYVDDDVFRSYEIYRKAARKRAHTRLIKRLQARRQL